MLGFLQEQETATGTTNLTRAGESMTFAPQDLIPVYNTIAQNFVVFDRWFADLPGPTNPNRWYSTLFSGQVIFTHFIDD